MIGFVLLGKVISVCGKSGEVKVKLFSEESEEIISLDFCYVDFFGSKKKLRIKSAKQNGKFLIFLFEGFDSQEASSVLLEKDLFLEREQNEELPEFSFLIKDLLNSKVFIDNELLGEIVDVLSLPGNDVYVVEDAKGKEILVPAVRKIINRFDKIEKKLYLKVDKSYFEDDEN
ncbi:MAG: ribosome maturation factor RimM [Ignavibacteriaceae bacterium]|nr:ribosome maturation factor RimM [Ignavibacteriaceae bacterium]